MTTTTPLPRRVRLGYGAGSVATGTFGTVPGLMLLPYLTDTVGVAPVLAGLLVLVPKAWDVVLNPIAGRTSDRTVDPRGPRRPWLLRGGLGLVLGFALLFAAPELPVAGAVAWVLVAFIATATAYAFFQVPYVAMPAELTDDPAERTQLLAWRVVLLALAILVAGGSAPAIRDAIGGLGGYRVMGFAMAGVLLIGVLAAYVGTRDAPIARLAPASGTLRDQLALIAQVKAFRVLLITFVVQALAFGAMLAGVDYLARYVLADSPTGDSSAGTSTILFLCFVGPGLLLTPLWSRLSRGWGKKNSYLVASGLLIVAALVLTGARSLPLAVVCGAVALAGVGYAGAQVFPMAMLPDVAAHDAASTGQSRIGVFTGIWTAGETLGLAVGPGLYALILATGGYASSSGGVAQSESAVTAIVLGFSLLPAVLIMASLWWLRAYSLSPKAL